MEELSFAACLNEYCAMICCTSKDLAEVSGVSASGLSRYRSGERTPAPDGDAVRRIAAGIAELSKTCADVDELSEQQVYERLMQSISQQRPSAEPFRTRLNELMDALSITNAELARHAHIDPSFLSRIRNGQRSPANQGEYARSFSVFIARRTADEAMAQHLLEIFAQDGAEPSLESALNKNDRDTVAGLVESWLLQEGQGDATKIEHFLGCLDEFDLNTYITAIHYDSFRVPTAPVTMPQSRSFYGIEGMREAELEFLKTTAASRRSREVVMYTDMEMGDLVGDGEFLKKYAMGVASMLKRGVTLSVVHDVTRPFDEMLMGLEGWIPLYMTGQVKPYYLVGSRDRVFGHLCNSSEVACLQAECIRGHHKSGRYVFSTRKDDVQYVQRRAQQLLGRAVPLMEMYRESDTVRFERFLHEEEARQQSGTGVRVGESMFSNMSIVCYGTEQVVIVKENDPKIAFVIYHPVLCDAIRNLRPIVVD